MENRKGIVIFEDLTRRLILTFIIIFNIIFIIIINYIIYLIINNIFFI